MEEKSETEAAFIKSRRWSVKYRSKRQQEELDLTGEVRRKVIFGLYKLPMVKTDNRRVLLTDGEIFQIGDIKIEAFLVPGHTWGHMVYLVDDAYLFTGDTIWFGADGGYSFINSLAEDKARRTKLVSADSRRKVLVFGAGVIGSYLAHVLCEAGNEVTILAREARAESLNRNGLVIRHHLQGKVTKDRVEAVTSVEGRAFDATFVVMPCHKLQAALPEIDKLQANLLVLVGNDVTPAEKLETWQKLRSQVPSWKELHKKYEN
ncbi:MAG: hypothetical protein K2K90_02320 [Lachnospiraceae bacterium]|nr:hypothetical protein [Lachnospiraceae bacterium]